MLEAGEKKKACFVGGIAPMGHEDAEGAPAVDTVPAAECPDSKSPVENTRAAAADLNRFGTDVEKVCEKGTVKIFVAAGNSAQAADGHSYVVVVRGANGYAKKTVAGGHTPRVSYHQGDGVMARGWADCPAGDMLGPVADNHGAECHIVVAVAGDDSTIVGGSVVTGSMARARCVVQVGWEQPYCIRFS